jgi:hypothetical protein
MLQATATHQTNSYQSKHVGTAISENTHALNDASDAQARCWSNPSYLMLIKYLRQA